MNTTGLEVGISATASTGICLAVNAEPLLSAIISLGVAIVTILATEGTKLLATWLQSKRKKIEEQDKENENKKEE